MIKRRALFASTAALAAMVLAGCSGDGLSSEQQAGSLADMDPITLKVSYPLADGSHVDRTMKKFLEYVKTETDGKVDYEIYSTGTLHAGREALSAIESGLTDITFHHAGYWPDELVAANWAADAIVPFSGRGFLQTGMSNTPAMQAMYEQSTDIRDALAKHKAVPLAIWGSPAFQTLCTDKLDTPEKFKGALVKTGGKPWTAQIESLGGVDTYVESPEHYEALQRGVIDCVTLGHSTFMNEGLWEVAKYNVPMNLAPALGSGFMMNKETWEGLPLEVQQIIHDGKSIILSESTKNLYGGSVEWTEKAPGMGIEIVDPTALNAVLDEHAAGLIDNRPEVPGVVSDPDQIVDSFRTAMDQWANTLESEFDLAPATPAKEPTTADQFFERWKSPATVNWDAYQDAIRSYLEKFRP